MRTMLLTLVIGVASCTHRSDLQCLDDSSCDLSGGGRCLAVETGHQWCAYPDPECPGGYRYSDVDVGDDLSGVCVPATSVPTFKLAVTVGGSASGSVASMPDGIACTAGTCAYSYPAGSQVELRANTTTGAFLGWSDACAGFETCTVTMDHDREVGALFGLPGQGLWVQNGGSVGNDLGRAIAIAPDGDLVVGGEFHGTVQLGTQSITSLGASDIFVAKMSALTGEVRWAKGFGGTADDQATAVAVDSSGNAYVVGNFGAAVNFGGGPVSSAGNVDAFVLSLDASGAYRWALGVGGTGFDAGRSVAVRGSSVIVAGAYQASMVLNGGTVISAGANDMFLVDLTTSGAVTWTRTQGGTQNDVPNAVAIDGDGNVIVAGRFGSTTSFGGAPITSAGFEDVFIAKYSASGAYLFAKRVGGNSFDTATSIATDAANNLYVLGTYSGTVDFGGGTPMTAASVDLFVAKYTLAGAYSWAKTYGPNLVGNTISADAQGRIAVSGHFCGTVSFGGPPISSVKTCAEADYDMFAVRLNASDGSHGNSVRAGGTSLDACWGAAMAPDGRTFVTGGFQGFAEFGGKGLTSNGEYDVVVLGLAAL